MIGPLALHGGGEFLPGDEPFLSRLLALAAVAARERIKGGKDVGGPFASGDEGARTIRIELLTTAIARHRPEMAFAVGSAAFERLAAKAAAGPDGLSATVRHARVVDEESAADESIAAALATADLIYLPGGDPDAVIEILAGSGAWEAVGAARARGAVVAGASAGAMALGERTWTRGGYVAGFGWAGRLVVVPHATQEHVLAMRSTVGRLPNGNELTILGLPERAGVTGGAGAWTVVGEAGCWWWPPRTPGPRYEPPGAIIHD